MSWIARLFQKGKPNKFAKMNSDDLNDFIEEELDLTDSKPYNYTNFDTGHVYDILETVNKDPAIYKISGFNPGEMVRGSRKIKAGDTMLMQTKQLAKVTYLILELTRPDDEDDMFFAHIVGIDQDQK